MTESLLSTHKEFNNTVQIIINLVVPPLTKKPIDIGNINDWRNAKKDSTGMINHF